MDADVQVEGANARPGKVKHAKRLIGIRLLFPSLDGRSIMDKCRVWVERHKHKYFVGWTAEQLEDIDPLVRPLDLIDQDLYKLHMNRNEFNRMKYLQFCLETDEPWAEEFRSRLSTAPEYGGFAGLNQAKVVATDLWRQHSADYRSCLSSSNKSSRSSQSSSPDEIAAKSIKLESNDTDWSSSPKGGTTVKQESVDSCQFGAMDLRQPTAVQRTEMLPAIKNEGDSEPSAFNAVATSARDERPGETTNRNDNAVHSDSIKQLNNFVTNILGPHGDDGDRHIFPPHHFATYTAPVFPFNPSLEAAGYYLTHSPLHLQRHMTSSPDQNSFDAFRQPSESDESQTSVGVGDSPSGSRSNRGRDWKWAPKSWRGKYGSNTEWKKSERGMSFLFPSISDQPLTLWEKVSIIVTRHKNNYFLDWTQEQINELDPLVRPKVLVTKERYKEYCHRNAMKYDSNLQFAMEGNDEWAEQFRARLRLEPEQGGFSNMCHVRSEAGRLWREHSGKYRHRNVVKENMDLNETKTGNSDAESSNTSSAQVPSQTNVALSGHAMSQHGKQKTLPVLPFQNESAVSAVAPGKRHQSSRLNNVISRLSGMKSSTDAHVRQNGAYGLEKNHALDWLWSCREMLHNVCREDPAASWHGRLRPYLHVFRERLGGDYEFPSSASGCIADLVLVLLDGEIQSTNFVQ